MEGTDQFNLRMSKSILYDLEFISRATGLSKNDWVRYNLATRIREEKEALLDKVENDYACGRISVKEFRRIRGCSPRKELTAARKLCLKRMKTIKFTQNAFQELLHFSKAK